MHTRQTDWMAIIQAERIEQIEQIERALNTSVILAKLNADGTFAQVNDFFCTISKYTASELIGAPYTLLQSGFHQLNFYSTIRRTLEKGELWTGDICHRAKDGTLYWTKTTFVPILKEGALEHIMTIQTDVTDVKNIDVLKQVAYYDDLTKLPNFRKFKMDFSELQHASKPFPHVCSLMLFSLKDYKLKVKRFGLSNAQTFLQEVAKRLQQITEKFDYDLFKLEEEQFLIFLSHSHRPNEYEQVVHEIYRLFSQPIFIQGHYFKAEPIIGIIHFPEHAKTFDLLLDRLALTSSYAEKQSDRKVAVYHTQMEEEHKYFLLLESALRRALQRNELELHYQPKIDLNTQQVAGVEALTRWYDKNFKHVPPNVFIPLAERRGFINDLGEWSLRVAAERAKFWNAKFEHNLTVAVNISPTHFMQPNFLDQLFQVLEKTKANPQHLQIEITEDVVMEKSEQMNTTLKAISDIGISLAIDDFGTGYSSFGMLNTFPIDSLKIDRSFVTDIPHDAKKASILEVMIKLGHALQLDVVIEGIETQDELSVLQPFAPEFAQGYYFSKPLPAKDLEIFIQKSSRM